MLGGGKSTFLGLLMFGTMVFPIPKVIEGGLKNETAMMDFILLLFGINKMLEGEVLEVTLGGGTGRVGEMMGFKIIQHRPNSYSLH